jgi:hypothetical protein
MDFRRSGQLDERRRRVLMDEIATSETDKSQPTTSAKGPVRAYSDSVLSDRQKRISEFIPLRPFALAATILLLITAVAAIEALYIHTTPPGGHSFPRQISVRHGLRLAGDHPFAALDLSARGNVGSWFSSMLFAGATLSVLGMLSIRAHRVDDYRGRYRVWWWVAAALAWASIDTATGLHDSIGQGIQLLAGDSLAGGHTLLWMGLYGVLFGTLALRASLEVWASLPAVVAGSCAGLLYFATMAVQLQMLPLPGGHVLHMVIGSSLLMLAHVSLVSCILCYARHVHFDAQGRLLVTVDAAPKKKKTKAKAKLAVVTNDEDEQEAKEEKKPAAAKKDPEKKEAEKKEAPAAAKSAPAAAASGLKFGSASSPTASASISSKTNSSPAQYDDEDEEDEDESGSKSDRKRLKKLARREAQQQRRAA